MGHVYRLRNVGKLISFTHLETLCGDIRLLGSSFRAASENDVIFPFHVLDRIIVGF